MIQVHFSSRFKRSYKKLPRLVQTDFDSKIEDFVKDPFNRRLKAHKLRGKLGEYYSFYLKDGYRVIFIFIDGNVLLVDVGPHDIYEKMS